jgi:catechol 2,3-dioxygenase-like lactoylglutathione lyase family enzyme
VDHLALKVSDQERSRRFYDAYCGFGAKPPRRYDDGTLMLFDGRGFSLALGGDGFVPHFGVGQPDADAVRAMARRLEADGVEIGHIVEFSWEPT